MSIFLDQIPNSNNCRYADVPNPGNTVTITSSCSPQDLAKSKTYDSATASPLSTTTQNQGDKTSTESTNTTPVPNTANGIVISSTISPTLENSTAANTADGTAISSTIFPTLGNSTAANPASPTAGNDKSGKGLVGGAVAGIAIGMLLAGVSIAALVFLLLLRRQRKRLKTSQTAYSPQRLPYSGHEPRPEKGATVVTAAVSRVDDLLPQPVEDDAIAGALSRIRDNIKNHVRTYYHSGPVSAADINESSVRNIAALTGSSAAILSSALISPTTRDTALRSVIGSIILARCTGERGPSLLPGELAGLVTSISESGTHTCRSKPPNPLRLLIITAQLNLSCSVNGRPSLEPCCNNDLGIQTKILVLSTASKMWLYHLTRFWRHSLKAVSILISAERTWT